MEPGSGGERRTPRSFWAMFRSLILSALGKNIWLRYVLVPGLTDKLDEIAGLAAFAASLGVVERVDILPFHKLGEFKWKECGREYKLAETEPPSRELVEQVRSIFRGHGLKAS